MAQTRSRKAAKKLKQPNKTRGPKGITARLLLWQRAERTGWNAHAALGICLDYIDSQGKGTLVKFGKYLDRAVKADGFPPLAA